MDDLNPVVCALRDLREDQGVPRNIKAKIDSTLKALDEQGEPSMRISRALHELEDVADDANVQPYMRTQLFNIVSLLEACNNPAIRHKSAFG